MPTTTLTGTEPRTEPRRHQPHDAGRTSQQACQSALHRLQLLLPETIAMGVVGPDGFEIAALSAVQLNKAPIQIPQLSALSSTLVAISQAYMLEAGLQASRHMILESPDGFVLLISIPVSGSNPSWNNAATYSLFVISGQETPLGRVLARARTCAEEIGAALSQT